MRIPLLIAGVAIGLGSMSFQAQATCNARGEFCEHPGWAANAFAAEDRTPALDYWTYGSGYAYSSPGDAPAYGYVAPSYTRSYGYVAPGDREWRYRRDYR